MQTTKHERIRAAKWLIATYGCHHAGQTVSPLVRHEINQLAEEAGDRHMLKAEYVEQSKRTREWLGNPSKPTPPFKL